MNYTKIYYQIINNRKVNTPMGYVEKHHIIPKSLGGNDTTNNIVKLTAREHFICHWLLLKMQAYKSKEYYKMLRAFLMMVQCRSISQDRHITSRKYETLRKEFSELQKVSSKGEGNSQYGTMWICNIIAKTNKKVLITHILDSDWVLGKNKWVVRYANCNNCNIEYVQKGKGKYCSKTCCNTMVNANKSVAAKYNNGYTVSVDNVIYKSISEAADTLGIGHETARMRFKSSTFSNYIIINRD